MAFWIGDGVFSYRSADGKTVKDITHGQELPKDLDKKVLDRLIKKKKATNTLAVAAQVQATDQSAVVADLTKKVADATAANEAATARIAELEGLLAAANETITELTLAGAAGADVVAGPKGGK